MEILNVVLYVFLIEYDANNLFSSTIYALRNTARLM